MTKKTLASQQSARWIVRSLVLFAVLFCPKLLAVSPYLEEMRPRGAQRGQAFTLTLTGRNLGVGTRIVSRLSATFTPLTSPRRGDLETVQEQLLFLVELDAEAEPGLYPIRLASPQGLSNILLFSVGVFPERMELEMGSDRSNDSPETSEPIDVPGTVNGTLAGPDQDVYRFEAKQGERFVIEVEARRAGSALDPVIRVLDANKRQLDMNNDALSLGVDCRLNLLFPSDGLYYVVVHDAKFSRQDENFYRLKLGSFTYAEGLFPLGWRRGEKTSVRLLGGNLTEPREVEVDLQGVDSDFVMISVPGAPGGLPIPFTVSDLPQVLERPEQKLMSLHPATEVHGQISMPGEVDRYRLAVTPGEEWRLELEAAGLGMSRLFGRLTVFDNDHKRLDSAGDKVPKGADGALIVHGRTSPDPYLNFKVPSGVHEVTVTVEDLVDRGGPLFGYRLSAQRQAPDFTLVLDTAYVNVPERGTALVDVTAQRRGYMGQIRLSFSDAPSDLIVEGGAIPSELDDADRRSSARKGVLTLTARQEAKLDQSELTLIGEGLLPDGTVIRRRARGPGLITQIRSGTGIPDTTFLYREERFTAPWLGFSLPLMVTKEIPIELVVEGPRQVQLVQGMTYALKWKFVSRDPSIQPPLQVEATSYGASEVNVRIPETDAENKETGLVYVDTTMGTKVGKFNLVASGEVEIQGSKHTIYSPATTIEVAQGYRIIPSPEGVILRAGSRAELVGKLERNPLFTQVVTIKPEDFPLGVFCRTTQVSADEVEFRVPCEAGESVEPGEFSIELTSSSTLAGRDQEQVPYTIPSVSARLVVPVPRDPLVKKKFTN